MAGGYDKRLRENVEHLEELREEAKALGVAGAVRFLPSFSDRQRSLLLARATAVLYTPVDEHFGIVPLEAMAAGRPVIACNSGGPLESVGPREEGCGILCDPTPAAFADAMAKLLDVDRAEAMGAAARGRAERAFSRSAFGDRLMEVVEEVCGCRPQGGVLEMEPVPAQLQRTLSS